MGRVSKWLSASILIASLHSSSSLARTWYIRSDGGGDAPTIQAAIDSAAPGDDVLVAAGTYTASTQGMATGDTYGRSMIRMRSGIVLHSESGPAVTVLDAQQQGRVLVCRACDASTRIEGFTITGGSSVRESPLGGDPNGIGGAIYCFVGAPVIQGNVLRDNFASQIGGAIATHHASVVVRSNSILWNTAGYRTGGVEILGSSARAVIEQNTIVGNLGGGVGCVDCKATVRRNIIAENGLASTWNIGGYAFFCLPFAVDSLYAECNITWGNTRSDTLCGIDGGGNQVVDPRFCISDPGGTGVRRLRPDSPALPQNNACDVLIGATGEGCGVTDSEATPGFSGATLRVTPNPMHERLAIYYRVPTPIQPAPLMVYDLRGRVVAQIPAAATGASGLALWDGRDVTGAPVSAGVYIVRLQTDRSAAAQKIVIMR